MSEIVRVEHSQITSADAINKPTIRKELRLIKIAAGMWERMAKNRSEKAALKVYER